MPEQLTEHRVHRQKNESTPGVRQHRAQPKPRHVAQHPQAEHAAEHCRGLDDRHLRARGHFVDVEHPEMGCTVTYSGAPFLAHGSPWAFRRRPPLLGEHTDEVLRGE